MLAAPAIGCVVAFILLPVLAMALHSFWLRDPNGIVIQQFTLASWREFLDDPFYLEVLARTGRLAAITTLICALVGYPVAYTLILMPERFRALMILLLFLPSWISFVVRTMSWLHVLGQGGLVNLLLRRMGLIEAPLPLLYNDFSIYVGMVHYTLTYMVLNIYIGLQSVDRNLVDAARTLGAKGWHAFLEITLPLSLPGLMAGSLLVFILAAGTYITPLILGGTGNVYYSNLIYEAVIPQLDWPLGATLAVVFIAVLTAVIGLYARLAGVGTLFRKVTA
jgi:spermidine/putrescine transport system permease protein